MPSFKHLLVETQAARATITLNRPESRNSLNPLMRAELAEALDWAIADDSSRVVVIKAHGKGFCAGADLAEIPEEFGTPGFTTHQLVAEFNPIIAKIKASPKPIVAVVNGAAAGFGASLALACDLVMMAEDAYLYSAFGAISLIPDGGLHHFLVEAVGLKRAYEVIAFSKQLNAKLCVELGLANRCVANEVLESSANDWIDELVAQAPLTLAHAKKLLNELACEKLQYSVDQESIIQDVLIRSRDFHEGSQAFFEKRRPEFTGK